MISTPVVQKMFTKGINDYNDFWEVQVGKIIELIYQNQQHFTSSYSYNADKTLKNIISNMRVVPIDIKETMQAFYKRIMDTSPPPENAGGATA